MFVKPINKVKAAFQLPEPEIKPWVIGFFRLFGSIYFSSMGFKGVKFIHPERFTGAFQRFFNNKSRLIVAFRHPFGNEPQLMSYVIGKILSKEAAKLGCRYPVEPHAHFIYGYEVPLWGGPFERWVLPRVGALPVYHVKVDMKSIRRIRELVKNGAYPLALAPEGQTSYSSDTLPRIEQGSARIALWCSGDLAKEKRNEEVEILPLSVHFSWPAKAGKSLEKLIAGTEKICGIKADPSLSLYQRLKNIPEKCLSILEDSYSIFSNFRNIPVKPPPNERLKILLEAALNHAEKILNIDSEGDNINRVYRIRQTAWDRMFRSDIKNINKLSPLEKRLADRLSEEAWLASRYMEFVDIGFYLDFEKLKPEDPLELYIETAQNYYDFAGRCLGGNIKNRIMIRGQTAHIVAGETIKVTNYSDINKKNSQKAVSLLTSELSRRFLTCIDEYKRKRMPHGE